jgi:cytoskeletal protein CcmA (bactofilin family)
MFFKSKKKSGRSESRQKPSEPSFIARDTVFEGNISSDGEIHIDGEVRGSIRTHTCLVDSHGEVHGGISAQFVVVRGRVLGPITASQVTIQAGAHVEGNVINENIIIENGAYVMGSITRSNLNAAPLVKDRFSATLLEENESENVLPMKLVK